MATGLRGRVRVASSPTLSANLMPECIACCATNCIPAWSWMLYRVQNGDAGERAIRC